MKDRLEQAEALIERMVDAIAGLGSYAASTQVAPLGRSQLADRVVEEAGFFLADATPAHVVLARRAIEAAEARAKA